MIKVPIGPSWDGTLWNYMARTSLFTENHWQGRWLALCLEWLQLSLVIFVCCCAFMLRRSHIVRYLPLFAGVILPFIALSIFSVYFNYVSNFNLRYIQPVLTGVIALYMLGVQKAADRDLIIVSSIGEGLAIAFCIISVIFYQLQLWFY